MSIHDENVSPLLGGNGLSPPPAVPVVVLTVVVWPPVVTVRSMLSGNTLGRKRQPNPSIERSNSTNGGLLTIPMWKPSLGVVMETKLWILAKERDPPYGAIWLAVWDLSGPLSLVASSSSLAEQCSSAVAAVFLFREHKLLLLLRSSAVMSFKEQFRGFPSRKKFLKWQKGTHMKYNTCGRHTVHKVSEKLH